nr:helicase protein MOM1-like isoform X1 [Tanacetum cinerariifolium]
MVDYHISVAFQALHLEENYRRTQNDSHNLSYSNSPSAGVPKENTRKVQCVVSPASGQSVPTDPKTQKEPTQVDDVQKLRLKSDHEKELAEVIAKMNRKYEAKCQDAEAAFQSKRKLRLKSDHENELAEVIAKMNRKYEAKCQDA